ncbi:MAG: nuclear transport factor 2 family protein, partial [Solirubrobacterales bacterium]
MATAGEAEATAREALVHAYIEAWNLHDPDAVAAFFAADGVYDDRGAGAVLYGSAAIRAHVAAVQAAFSDLR